MRGWFPFALRAIFLVVLSPAAAAADEKPNPFGGFVDLSIWTAVVFLLLLFVLSKTAWPRMLQGLERREKHIAAAVEEAKAARDEAAKLRVEIEMERKKASEQVAEMLADARKSVEQSRAEYMAQARAEIAAERDRFRREVDTARDQTVQEMSKQLAQLAAMISSKAIRRQLTETDHRDLVDEALNEMNQAIADRRRFVRGDQA